MHERAVKELVNELNRRIMARPWFDFEVLEYGGGRLVIAGGIDPTVAAELEIHFEEVFFYAGVMNWKTDTSTPCLSLLTGPAALDLNLEYKVERGNHLFRFAAEGYPTSFGCVLASKSISFSSAVSE
jgi:hypothetical protein